MNFEYMNQFCRDIFKIKTDYILYYFDEDEDMIELSSDEDISVMNHFENDKKFVSIFIDILDCHVEPNYIKEVHEIF